MEHGITMDCLGSEWTQEIVIMHIEILLFVPTKNKLTFSFSSQCGDNTTLFITFVFVGKASPLSLVGSR